MWAKELKLKGCKKIDSIWHKRNLPLTQLLLLRVSLLQQILPLSRWFQMSSSWPDSLTTWLFLRTDNPPQPLPPVFTRSVLRENTRLFILPAALVETYTHPTPHHLAWFLWDMAIYVQWLINPLLLMCWKFQTVMLYIFMLFANPPDVQIWPFFKGSFIFPSPTNSFLPAEIHKPACTVLSFCFSF